MYSGEGFLTCGVPPGRTCGDTRSSVGGGAPHSLRSFVMSGGVHPHSIFLHVPKQHGLDHTR